MSKAKKQIQTIKKGKDPNERGQALLLLLFFVSLTIIVTTAAVIIIIGNELSGTRLQEGTISYYSAESGIENALLCLLRNPSYTGETMSTPNGTIVIQVTGSNPYTITSQSTSGAFIDTIQVTATYNNTILNITNWKETF